VEADILREEPLLGGVVHVDRVPVGHVDADLPEGIDLAGVLPQGVVHGPLGGPVEGLRVHLQALAVEDPDLHLAR
jgi:hypothetical protein